MGTQGLTIATRLAASENGEKTWRAVVIGNETAAPPIVAASQSFSSSPLPLLDLLGKTGEGWGGLTRLQQ